MALEGANYISELQPTSPTGQDPRAEGDDELRQLKLVLKTQFPNLGTVAVAPTAVELNSLDGVDTSKTLETRLALLEDLVIIHSLPTYARDFSDNWWTLGPDQVPQQRWLGGGRKDEYSNVPWQWGAAITPGEQGHTIQTMVTRIVSYTGGPAFNDVLQTNLTNNQTVRFWRVAADSREIINAPWYAHEFTIVESDELAPPGKAISSTVCGTIAQLCP